METCFGLPILGPYSRCMISVQTAYERLQSALADARREAKLTQADVARVLARPQSFVSKYETGERRLDVVEFLEVCEAVRTDPVGVLRIVAGARLGK